MFSKIVLVYCEDEIFILVVSQILYPTENRKYFEDFDGTDDIQMRKIKTFVGRRRARQIYVSLLNPQNLVSSVSCFRKLVPISPFSFFTKIFFFEMVICLSVSLLNP